MGRGLRSGLICAVVLGLMVSGCSSTPAGTPAGAPVQSSVATGVRTAPAGAASRATGALPAATVPATATRVPTATPIPSATRGPSRTPRPTAPPAPAVQQIDGLTVRAATTLGRSDAPVTVIEFTDFQCRACRDAHYQIDSAVVNQYVADGTARLVIKHLPLTGPESVEAALAAECAADQGKFWAYQDGLYSRQRAENSGVFTAETLQALAAELGLDGATFATCLQTRAPADRLAVDQAEAAAGGADYTPAFFVNGKRVDALAYADLARAINAAAP